jgi:ribose transport system permease protein
MMTAEDDALTMSMANGSAEADGLRRPGAPGGRQRLLRRATPYTLLGVVVVEYFVFAALKPGAFLTTDTLSTILSSQAPLLIATLDLTLTLITNEFDLTLGANLVFTDVMVAALAVNYHLPIGLAVVVALLAGTLVGVINAVLVVGLKINSFIATLGMSTLLTGVGLAVAGSTIISDVPHPLVVLAGTNLFSIPLAVYYAFGLALLMWYVYEYTPLGRYLYFTGASVDVARLSGLPTNAIKAGAFVASAVITSFAGLMEAGTVGSADPTAAPSFLLPAFAGAFLGATAIKVGRFNIWGTMVASYLLFTGITGLALLGLTGWVQDAFNGAALLVAIIAARLTSRTAR